MSEVTPRIPSKNGQPAWEAAYLHPPQGSWSEEEFLKFHTNRMAELADGFVALPGGFGTLEEIIETITWAQLGLHAKPCGLLNAAGYYDGLLAFLDHAVAQGFVRAEHRAMLQVAADPADLLDLLAGYLPAAVPKWRD